MKKIGFSTYLTMFLGAVMLVAFIDATYMPFMAALYPACIAGTLVLLVVAQVIHDFRKGASTEGALDIGKADTTLRVRYVKGTRAFAWILGFYLAVILLGFKLGAVAYILGYLYFEDKGRWLKIVIVCAAIFLLLDFFRRFLDVWWPVGLLGDLAEESMPWLF